MDFIKRIALCNINKRMFYVNTRKNSGPIKQKQLLDAMLVPPEERLTRDHQIIYRFFIANQMLKQLERTKSLNARIKCIAALLLINRQDYLPDEHILMHVFEDQRVIILPIVSKATAEIYNQKLIRRKMDLLSTFSMMQSLKYDQLLYLAFNMEEISCKYKDYLYREGEMAEFFYLIVEGEFHYVKDCNERQPRIKISKKDKNPGNKLRSIDEDEQSPNKYVKPHINRYRIGIVEGHLGQAVGLEELILEEHQHTRRYSIICNSTQNKCVQINKKYLETLFEELPDYHQQIYNQIRDANSAKIDLLQRIKLTKSNLKQYLRKSVEKLEKSQERYQEQQMRSLQNVNDQSLSKVKLPYLQKKSSLGNEYKSRNRSRLFSSALTGSLPSEENQMKSLKSQSNLETDPPAEVNKLIEQDEGSFAITSLNAQSNRKPLRSPSREELQSQSNRISQVRESTQIKSFDASINLPLIGRKSIADLDGSKISLKHITKAKSRMHQYGGMIDCNRLVEEKQDILERKQNKITRQEIFPIGHINYKQPRKSINEDPMKLKASPAHSNRFMEKMLLKVLKKAGYDEASKEIHYPKETAINATINVKPVANAQLHRSLSKHKKKDDIRQNKTANKEDLLVDSAFDDCYFAKI